MRASPSEGRACGVSLTSKEEGFDLVAKLSNHLVREGGVARGCVVVSCLLHTEQNAVQHVDVASFTGIPALRPSLQGVDAPKEGGCMSSSDITLVYTNDTHDTQDIDI